MPNLLRLCREQTSTSRHVDSCKPFKNTLLHFVAFRASVNKQTNKQTEENPAVRLQDSGDQTHSHISVLKATMASRPWTRTPNRSVRAPLSQPCGFALLMSDMFVTSKTPSSRDTPLSPDASMLTAEETKKKGLHLTTDFSFRVGLKVKFSFSVRRGADVTSHGAEEQTRGSII